MNREWWPFYRIEAKSFGQAIHRELVVVDVPWRLLRSEGVISMRQNPSVTSVCRGHWRAHLCRSRTTTNFWLYLSVCVRTSVWPDAEIKSSPSFSKCCPKIALPVWLYKQWFSQLANKSPNIWATWVSKFAAKKLQKSPNLVTLEVIYISPKLINLKAVCYNAWTFTKLWKQRNLCKMTP